MRSFTIMSAVMAIGSLAQPLNEKRAVAYVTETEVTYETVWVAPNAAIATPTPEVQAAAALESEVETPMPTPTPVAAPAPVVAQVAASPKHNHADAHKSAPAAPAPVPAGPVVQAQAEPAPAPAAPAADTSSGGNSFEAACVDSHNTLRAQHGAGSLSWDDDLAASAQALAATCIFEHHVDLGPASNYGQNIAMSYGTLGMHDKTAEAVSVISDSWYTREEQKFAQLGLYGMANPVDHDFDAWGHFTQEVWKGTTKVGCAVQSCTGSDINGYYTVCNYNPAGNYGGEYALNVSN